MEVLVGRTSEQIFRKVLKCDPNFGDALRDESLLLMFRSDDFVDADTRRAIALLKQAVSANPKKSGYFYLACLARSWLEGEENSAERHLREALRLDPQNVNAAQALCELGGLALTEVLLDGSWRRREFE